MTPVARQTPRQSAKLVYRQLLFSAVSHAGFVVVLTISLAVQGGPVLAITGLVLAAGLPLLVIRSWLWGRRRRMMKARAARQIPYWPAGAPPALAAALGLGMHERGGDRPVPGRVTFADGALAWHPTTRRVPSGYPTELRWDTSWRRTMDRPWYLWIYGGGRLTLSRPGAQDAVLWISYAHDFQRLTQTPSA
jgi:hypothetical protein